METRITKEQLLSTLDNCALWLDTDYHTHSNERELRGEFLERYIIELGIVDVPSAKSYVEYLLDGKDFVLKTSDAKLRESHNLNIDYIRHDINAVAQSLIMRSSKNRGLDSSIELDDILGSKMTIETEIARGSRSCAKFEMNYPEGYLKNNPPRNDEEKPHRSVYLYFCDEEFKITKPSVKVLQSLKGFSLDITFSYGKTSIGHSVLFDDASSMNVIKMRDIPEEEIRNGVKDLIQKMDIPDIDTYELSEVLSMKVKKHFKIKSLDDYNYVSIYHPSVGMPVEHSGINRLLGISKSSISAPSLYNLNDTKLFRKLVEKLM